MTRSREAMLRLFRVGDNRAASVEPQVSIFPGYQAPVVRNAPDGERELVMLSWGYVLLQKDRAPRRVTDGPASDRAEKMALYGQFVGTWDTDVVSHEQDGAQHRGHGEIHFGWVLEGRAIQDVWMIPRREERRAGMPAMPVAGNWYGTTLRIYDPRIDLGISCGLTRPTKFTPSRSGGRAATTSFRKGSCQMARSCAGALRKSPPIPSIGSASFRKTAAPHGGFKSRCSPGARQLRCGKVVTCMSSGRMSLRRLVSSKC